MRSRSPSFKYLPLDIVGSTAFGRYHKISSEQTFNMIISDGWLVPYAGYANVASISPKGQGRGLYTSANSNQMIAVIDNGVYTIDKNLSFLRVGSLNTFDGDVFISENNGSQIAICDKSNIIYIFNYTNNTFQQVNTGFLPGYITFMDTYFIAPDLEFGQWRLSGNNDGTSWPAASSSVGQFQTKPDRPIAAVHFPGKGNLLLVFGRTVTEFWYDVGYQLFPMQKNVYYNIDYGCLNPSSIAASDKFVVWLAVNEKSGPVIMFSDGSDTQQISNDGINYLLANLSNPTNCYGFLFKQDGHLLYQFAFPDDNLSFVYDFNTKLFFTVTDPNMNYHIAKHVVAFNNSYYFISFSDGNIYELNTKYTTFNGAEAQRARVCKNIRLPDASNFIVNNMTFTLEQGDATSQTVVNTGGVEVVQQNTPIVDLAFSINGGKTFSSYERYPLNPVGQRINRIDFWSKGMANDFVPQFRFWGMGRFIATNGEVSIYQ